MSEIATAGQIRAARYALNWSIECLSEASGVSVRTIIRYESYDGVPPSRSGNLQKLIHALEAGGIEFIGAPGDRPGVRIRGG